MRQRIVKEEVVYSDLIAIADDRGNKITYKELAEEAERLLPYIEERSLIFVLCDHQTETVKLIYNLLYLNMVPLALAADMDEELVDNLIVQYRPQYIYCSKSCEMGSRYQYKIEFERHIILKTGEKKCETHPDIALLLSTSGTTGSPKLVKLSYGNLYNNAEQMCSYMDIHCGQKGISPLSMSYVYGLTFCIWHWHCGATLLITEESILSKKFHEFYEKEKVNHFGGTPYIYQMLQRIGFWDEEKIKYLHWAASAGSQMSDGDQIRMVSTLKDKFWILYGQAECTGVISGMNFDENNIKLGSVGKVFEDVEISIDSSTSELILKSPNICMGYADSIKQLSDGDVNQGTIHTGDAAYIDEDGCVYLRGRLSRYAKILGKRVSLDDIERYLNNTFSGVDFACAGADDNVVIFYSGEAGKLNEKILVLLDSKMKIPKKFITFFYLKEIPRSRAGKVMYEKLNEMGIKCRKKY